MTKYIMVVLVTSLLLAGCKQQASSPKKNLKQGNISSIAIDGKNDSYNLPSIPTPSTSVTAPTTTPVPVTVRTTTPVPVTAPTTTPVPVTVRTTTPVPVTIEAPAACLTLTDRGGVAPPTMAFAGTPYMIGCDYGKIVNSIGASNSVGNCIFTGFDSNVKTMAKFSCPTSNIGIISNSCFVLAKTSDNTCASQKELSNTTVAPSINTPESQIWTWLKTRTVADQIDFILKVMGGQSGYVDLEKYNIEDATINSDGLQAVFFNPSKFIGTNYYSMFKDVLLRTSGFPEKASYSQNEINTLQDIAIDSFTVSDIYKFKSGGLTGCSGHARVFQDLASRLGLQTKYVLTATATRYDNACYPVTANPPPGSHRFYRKANPDGYINSGHQVVAVLFEDGLWRVINSANTGIGLTPLHYAQWQQDGTKTFISIAVSNPAILVSSSSARNRIYFPDIYQSEVGSNHYIDPWTIHSPINYNIIAAVLETGIEKSGTERTNLSTSGLKNDNRCIFPVITPIPANVHSGCNKFCTVSYCQTMCNNLGNCSVSCSSSPTAGSSAALSCASNPNETKDCTETCDGKVCTTK